MIQREEEILDTADLRIVDMLSNMAQAEDDSALRETLMALSMACEEGSLCLPSPGLSKYSIIGGPADPTPLILHRDRLYFHRHFHAEKSIAEGLLRLLNLGSVPCDPKTVESVLREILEDKPLRTGDGQPLRLTEKQKQALDVALGQRVFLLSGGPGTGKTALTASLLRGLIRLRKLDPQRIRLCAPTGRAAQRLQESLQQSLLSLGDLPADHPDARLLNLPVETLHRLLGYHPSSGRFARHPGDPLHADLVLLDEASMADAFSLSALVQALQPNAALILVGDADQLPAVGTGSVLSELLPMDRKSGLGAAIPTVILDRSHRARQDLLDFAEAINNGDAETVLQRPRLDAPEGDFANALPGLLDKYADSVFRDKKVQGKNYMEWLQVARKSQDAGSIPAALSALMEILGSERILACLRHGPLGCERVNTLLRRKLEPLFDPSQGKGHFSAFHGAPLLITRNDTRTGLSNGEIGIWLRDRQGLTAWFQRGGEWLRFPAAFLPSWESAFATTVHKSQGSECDEVLLILAEEGNRLLTREILYTAVTRARKSVRIFGSELALREAVANRLQRWSGLRDYFSTIS